MDMTEELSSPSSSSPFFFIALTFSLTERIACEGEEAADRFGGSHVQSTDAAAVFCKGSVEPPRWVLKGTVPGAK